MGDNTLALGMLSSLAIIISEDDAIEQVQVALNRYKIDRGAKNKAEIEFSFALLTMKMHSEGPMEIAEKILQRDKLVKKGEQVVKEEADKEARKN